MGKRSAFARRPMDDYDTPVEAVKPLLPHLLSAGIQTFAEPCCGSGRLVEHLTRFGFSCVYQSDLERDEIDALAVGAFWLIDADVIITNPPWTRDLLHPLIQHFLHIKPTWLLFDADWPHTRQAAPYIRYCAAIVSVGRVKWIPDSPYTGKDNAAWYLFDRHHHSGPRFYGREAEG